MTTKRSGLVRKVKVVRGKHGSTKRTYWVKSTSKGKTAAGVIRSSPGKALGQLFLLGVGAGAGSAAAQRLRKGKVSGLVGGLAGASLVQEAYRRSAHAKASADHEVGWYKNSSEPFKLRLAQLTSGVAGYALGRTVGSYWR